MTVFGVDAVTDAAAAGGTLAVRRGDLVTPLARDLAAELGVDIVASGSPPAAVKGRPVGVGSATAAGPPSPISPPSPALYRRGSPLPSRLLPRSLARTDLAALSSTPPTRVPRIVVVGAGHVGTITAMRLAEADLADEIVLVDIVGGLAEGIALDIGHSAGLLGFSTTLRGEHSVEAAGEAAYTVLTAGRARQPGMSRGDLADTNAAILGPVARSVGATSPNGVILVVTNPLDEMTHHVWKSSGLPSGRVVGMAGMLDAARFSSLAGLTGVARAGQIEGYALGSHGDEMVIPRSQLAANGKALTAQLDPGAIDALITRTRDSGAEIVALLGTGSAFITPGLSAAQMVIRMIRSDDRVVSATVMPAGEYGIDGTYVGLPVRLGRSGLREIVHFELTGAERAAVVAAASRIAERVRSLPVPGP